MAGILRGDIRWADLNPTRGHEQTGKRPVLILSHDVFNDRSGTVIAMALTSQPPRAGFLSHWSFNRKRCPGVHGPKSARLRTLAVERIGKRIGKATVEEIASVLDGLNEIVGIKLPFPSQ